MLFSNMLGRAVKRPTFGNSVTLTLWTPDQLGTALQMWFDTSDLATITKNASNIVSAMANKGSLGSSASVAAGSPAYSASTAGYPAILGNASQSGDGSGSLMAYTNPSLVSGGASRTVLYIGAGSSGLMMGSGDGSGMGLDSPTTVSRYSLVGSATNGTLPNTNSATQAFMYSWDYDAGLNNMYLNGAADLTLNKSFNTTTTFNFLGWAQVPAYKQQGLFRTVLVINGKLSTANRQKLEGWAARQFGITLSSDHPYFSSGPTL